MVVQMSLAPLMVLSLAGMNCVEKWKTIIGPYGLLREEWFYPYSVRTRFGIQPGIADVLHASENIQEGKKETRYFFPRSKSLEEHIRIIHKCIINFTFHI